MTTPNGSQFSNPFRRKSPTPAYRSNLYGRHSYLYTLDELIDMVEVCGFKVVEAGYWSVYERKGWSSIYDYFARIPLEYCRAKFMKTIFVVGEKEKDMEELDRHPRIYDPRGDWEFIRNSN